MKNKRELSLFLSNKMVEGRRTPRVDKEFIYRLLVEFEIMKEKSANFGVKG